MIPPRQAPVRPLDLAFAGAVPQPEDDVEIHGNHADCGYLFSSSTTSASITSPGPL